MSLISIIVALVVVGVLLWAVEQLPMDAAIKSLIRIVVIVAVVLWLVSVFFGGTSILHTRVHS